jgi:hypothetical protein
MACFPTKFPQKKADHVNSNGSSPPVESGATARVYRGICDGVEVAIKDFRLRCDQFHKIKRVSKFGVFNAIERRFYS